MNGETPLHWIGSAKKDLLAFPEQVITAMGYALPNWAAGIPMPNLGKVRAAVCLKS